MGSEDGKIDMKSVTVVNGDTIIINNENINSDIIQLTDFASVRNAPATSEKQEIQEEYLMVNFE